MYVQEHLASCEYYLEKCRHCSAEVSAVELEVSFCDDFFCCLLIRCCLYHAVWSSTLRAQNCISYCVYFCICTVYWMEKMSLWGIVLQLLFTKMVAISENNKLQNIVQTKQYTAIYSNIEIVVLDMGLLIPSQTSCAGGRHNMPRPLQVDL